MTSKFDTISVIIPVYNVEPYLKECLDSIVNQTYKNLEIILVDDGSPDNCGKICDVYAKKDNRIRVIHKENGGLSSARNVGLDIATGEYISFIDSDDYVAENFIERLYTLLINNDADIAQCDYSSELLDNILKENIKILSSIQAIELLNNIKYHSKFVIACNKIYKASLFKEIRFPLGKISEDAFTTYLLFDNVQKIIVIDDVLYYYRRTFNSITNRRFSTKRYDALEAYEGEIRYFENGKQLISYKSACVLYQHILKRYYLMTYKYVDENKKENLRKLSNKIRKNLINFVKYSSDSLNLKIKVVLFSTFPNLFACATTLMDRLKK